MGSNQEAAAVGRDGPHELETRHGVPLALIATSTFNEAHSPSPWHGKSLLAHQVSAGFERHEKHSLCFSTNLDGVFSSLSAFCLTYPCRRDSPSRCFPFAGTPCAAGGVLSESLVLCRTAVAACNAPGSAELTLLFRAGLLSNIPACLETRGGGCIRLCERGHGEQ